MSDPPVANRSRKKRRGSVLGPTGDGSVHQEHSDNYWTLRNKLIQISIIISSLSILVSGASVLVATGALSTSIRNQRELKGIDLLSSFQQRYDQLVYDIKDRVPDNDQVQARKYYHRFWDLQFEQYQYWKLGLIKPEIYSSWMDFRREEWAGPDKVGGITFQDGWDETEKGYLSTKDPERNKYYKDFTDFMDKVFKGDSTVYSNGPPAR